MEKPLDVFTPTYTHLGCAGTHDSSPDSEVAPHMQAASKVFGNLTKSQHKTILVSKPIPLPTIESLSLALILITHVPIYSKN